MTLTTDAQSTTGTSGDDTFRGTSAATAEAATDTLGAADQIDGGDGTDTFEVTNTATNTGALGEAAVSNVEIFNIRQTLAAGTSTFNATLVAGETAVNSKLSSGTVTVTGLASGASSGVIGNGSVVTGAFNAGWAATVTSNTLNFQSGTVAGDDSDVVVTSAASTLLTINSTGAANEIDNIEAAATTEDVVINATTDLSIAEGDGTGITNIAASATSTITVNGSGEVSLGSVDADVDTLTAGSGDLTATLLSNNTNFAGGAGNDVITVTEGQLYTGTNTLAASTGTDTLVIFDEENWTTTTVANFSGFDVLRVNDDADEDTDTFDLSLEASINALQIGATAHADDDVELTNVTAAQAAAITLRGDLTGDLNVGVANATNPGTADSVTLTFNNATDAADVDIGGALILAGTETLNIVSTDAGTNVNSIASIGAASTRLHTVNISGAEDFSFTLGQDLNLEVVNASTATGAITVSVAAETADGIAVTTNTGNDNITGGAGADSLTGGQGNDTIAGGAGADTIVAGTGDDSVTGGDGADTINFGSGTDTYVHDAANDSRSDTVVSGTTDISATVDVVTGAGNGDLFSFALTTALAAAIADEAVTTTMVTRANADLSGIDIVRGTYNSTTGIFTSGNASGDNDYAIQVTDAEGAADATLHTTVLMDVVGTVTFDATAAGVITFQVA